MIWNFDIRCAVRLLLTSIQIDSGRGEKFIMALLRCEDGSAQDIDNQRNSYLHHTDATLVLPTEANCFLCSASYFASLGSNSEETRDRILSICRAFGICEDSERSLLLKLTVTDPLCLSCSDTVNQLNGWLIQLDLVQDRINALKKNISQSILRTCPSDGRRVVMNDEYIKTRILEKYKGMSSVPYSNPAPTSSLARNDNELRLCYDSTQKYTINYNDLIHVQLPAASSHALDPDTVSSSSDNEANSNVQENFFDEMEIADSLEVVETTPKLPARRRKVKNSNLIRRKKASTTRRKAEKISADPGGQCHMCPRNFPTQFALKRHIKRQHYGISYQCHYCDKAFSGTSNRNRHEMAVHIATSRDFICEICGKDYRTRPSLQGHHRVAHMRIIPKNRETCPSECEHCGKVLSSVKNLSTHIRLRHRHAYIPRICPTCGKPCHDNTTLRKHELSHQSPWERALTEGITLFYKCELCPQETQIGFNSKASLAEHYSVEHKDEPRPVPNIKKIQTKPKKTSRRFVCLECPYRPSYSTAYSLKMHVKSGHVNKRRLEPGTEKMRFTCEICGKPCKDRYAAQQHVGTHVPRPTFLALYTCSICNNGEGDGIFHKIKEFRKHYTQCHPDEEFPEIKPFNARKSNNLIKCPECPDNIGFTCAKSLRNHIKNGHGRMKRGKKSNLEKGLPAPVRKKKTQKTKIKVEIPSSESEGEDDGYSEPANAKAEEWIVPEVRSRHGRVIRRSAKYGHKNVPVLKELRIRLTRL